VDVVKDGRLLWAAALALAALFAAGPAAASDDVSDETEAAASTLMRALEEGSLGIDLRYRFEYVDSESFDKRAYASTLRGALSYETGSLHGFRAGVTFETVTAIGNDLLYNNAGSGSLWNEVTDRPVVADPAMVEVDRLWVGYRGSSGLDVRLGRFAYTLDNQRFVGIAPWRQNYRSFDGASIALGSTSTLRASYAYLGQVHYNNGADPSLDAHLVHLSREIGPGELSGYGYLLDWEADDRAGLSSATYGVRYTGRSELRPLDLLYFAEYARQLDYGDNPNSFALDYGHLGLGAQRGPWTIEAAWELRDGNGVNSVQTPLGTNHGKNGFADRMVVNPPTGSEDLYVRLRFDRPRWSWLLSYHDFDAALGGESLGRELDMVARFTVRDPLEVFLKVARYDADTWLTDVTKVMLWASWSFETGF
jgi:hypothetical protein